MKPLKLSQNFWIILTTFIVLILAYLFYLNIYVKTNEDKIVSTRLRVLEQIGNNIKEKKRNYHNNAKELVEKIKEEIGNIDTIKKNSQDFDLDYVVDTIIKKRSKEIINKEITLVKVIKSGAGSNITDICQDESIKDSRQDLIYICDLDSIKIEKDSIANIILKYKIESLVNGLMRKDIFDDYLLIKDSTISYNTISQNLLLSSVGISYDKFIKGSPDDKEEARNSSEEYLIALPEYKGRRVGNIFSGQAFDVKIFNESYKLFIVPIKIDDTIWYLGGLMESAEFRSAVYSVAPGLVLIVSLLLIMVILLLPVIKVFVMSKTEQLHTSIIINSGLILLLGGSLMALLYFALARYDIDLKNIDTQLENLSEDVKESFYNELDTIHTQLTQYDLRYQDIGINKDTVFQKVLHHKHKDSIIYPKYYPYFDYTFWINQNGIQSTLISPYDNVGVFSNVSHRKYFQQKDDWYLPTDNNKNFMLESIVSITSGIQKAAVSKSSIKQDKVIALTTRLHSVINTILPKEYEFCIIDESGVVCFHSRKGRNLMENLLTECQDNKNLSAALYSKISHTFNVNYYNNPYRIHIKPLGLMPLYLVTFYDIQTHRSFQKQVFTYTLILISCLLFYIFVQCFVMLIVERTSSHLEAKNIIFDLCRPKMAHNNKYKHLITKYIIITILVAAFLFFINGLLAIISIFICVSAVYTYSYYVLYNYVIKKLLHQRFLIFNVVVIVILNLFAGFYLQGQKDYWLFLLLQLLVYTTLMILKSTKKTIESSEEDEDKRYSFKFLDKLSYLNSYAGVMLGMFILFGIIPTYKFYDIANDIETKIRLRDSQLQIAKQIVKRDYDFNSFYKNLETNDSIIESRKAKGLYILHNHESKVRSDDALTSKGYNDNNSDNSRRADCGILERIVCNNRAFYDDYIISNKYLLMNDTINKLHWDNRSNDTMILTYTSPLVNDPGTNPVEVRIESLIPHTNYLFPFNNSSNSTALIILKNVLFWISIIMVLIVIFSLIRIMVRRIYCLKIVDIFTNFSFHDLIIEKWRTNKCLFIFRLSALDNTDNLEKDIFYNDDNKLLPGCEIIDCSFQELTDKTYLNIKNQCNALQKDPSENSASEVKVLIKFFDLGFYDPDLYRKNIGIIQKIMSLTNIKIILLSQEHPDKILDYYKTIIESSRKDEKQATEWMRLQENFRQLYENLVVLYYPVSYHYSQKDEYDRYKKEKDNLNNERTTLKKTQDFFEEELGSCDYLRNYKSVINNYLEYDGDIFDCNTSEDGIISKLHILAGQYYTDIIQSCSFEEKFVLNDLADDMIINSKNFRSIYTLLFKGILRRRTDTIVFMNKSIRRYLLMNQSRNFDSDIDKKLIKDSGTWKGYKFTIVLIIIGLLIFLGLANRNYLDDLYTLFIALGAGIATITSVLSLISKRNKEEAGE